MILLPTSNREIHRFVPDSCKEMENPPTYLVATPTVFSQAQFLRLLAENGVRFPGKREIFEALRRGVSEFFPGEEERGALLALVDLAESDDGDMTEEEMRQFNELDQHMTKLYPPMAEMNGERIYYRMVAPLIAFMTFCVGFENVAVAYEKCGGILSRAVVEKLPAEHVRDVGAKIFPLINLTENQEKNSDSPSKSAPVPQISAED